MRSIVLLVALAVSAPATAQMNPASIGLGMVMPSALNAQAKNLSNKRMVRGRRYSEQDAINCAAIPQYKRERGRHDPGVLKFERMCRRDGYSTGE